jgi:hypothetical protein
MILQLSPPIEVKTPLGYGWCIFIIDYSININTIWVVRLKDGIVKHFDANDILVQGNEMLKQEKL